MICPRTFPSLISQLYAKCGSNDNGFLNPVFGVNEKLIRMTLTILFRIEGLERAGQPAWKVSP